MLTVDFRVRNRVLRHNTAVVFDLDIKSVARQDSFPEFENPSESIGAESVFGVSSDMCLQQDLFFSARLTAAVDKVSYHVTDLSYMRMNRNVISIR